MTYHIFIGYDDREHEPFLVAKHTLLKYAKVPIKIHKLHHKPLRESGLFNREWLIDSKGQYVDKLDGKPFSTQFSHSRFLVPELWRNLSDPTKNPLVMFVDCDFLWRSDIGCMFEEIETKRLAEIKSPVYCVQHDYRPKSEIKMDNIVQSAYNMKLWSAMMVFDMDHLDNSKLTSEVVNSQTGRWLHNFGWVGNTHSIGTIKPSWHFVPNHSENGSYSVDAIHYTEGGPWFPSYRQGKYSQIWWNEYNDYLKTQVVNIGFNVEGLIDG